MIDVICSTRLPSGMVQLVELLKKNISSGDFKPFPDITAEEIVTMDWLADNVDGTIPTINDLAEEARPVVEVQGVAKAKEQDTADVQEDDGEKDE